MYYRFVDLDWTEHRDGTKTAEVELDRGDSVRNPASTKNLIYGPCTVRFTEYRDGGVTAVRS